MNRIEYRANRTAWTKLRREYDLRSLNDLAGRLNVPSRYLGRTVEGHRNASPDFVARTLVAFRGHNFAELFTVRVVRT